ncbi:MAG: hypothetical protein EXS31_02670 [Pedosphaera sp.]|nr:hypothetical protein [Pedosphaera sp.]
MNLNLQNRQQLLTILALVAIGLWAGDSLVLSPLLKSWEQRKTTIKDLRLKIDKGSQLLSRERSIRDHWQKMRTNMLPTEVSAAEGHVLKAFDQWSQDSRISITSVRPQWKRTAEEYATLECRVDAYGSMSTITRFLYEVEHDSVALKVDSIELSARDNDGSQLTLGLQVSGLQLSANTR